MNGNINRTLAATVAVVCLVGTRAWAGVPLGQTMETSRVGTRLSQRLTQAREESEESETRRLTPVVRQRTVAGESRQHQVVRDASRALKTRRVVAAQQ